LIVVPVGGLVEVAGEDQRAVGALARHRRLDDERLVVLQVIGLLEIELLGKTAHVGKIDFL